MTLTEEMQSYIPRLDHEGSTEYAAAFGRGAAEITRLRAAINAVLQEPHESTPAMKALRAIDAERA